MNKIHPAVMVAGIAAGLFAGFAVIRALLTKNPEAPKAITSDIPATPGAAAPAAQATPDEETAASGTA